MPYKDKLAQAQYQHKWHQDHKRERKLQANEKRHLNKDRLRELKCSLSCQICGASHPAILDFHHRDPSEKLAGIAVMLTRHRASWSKILEEMDKCDVLCKNCHAIQHWNDRNNIA